MEYSSSGGGVGICGGRSFTVIDQHSFFHIIELLRGLRDEQIRMLGFEPQSLHLDEVRRLVSSFPELLDLDVLALDTLPTIRGHTFTLNELSPFRSVLFLHDLRLVVVDQTTVTHISHLSMALRNPMLSENNRFDLLRQFCGCIARVPPEHALMVHRNRMQLRLDGVLKELGVEENQPFFVPLVSALFEMEEDDFLSLGNSLLNMGARYLHVLAKVLGVDHDTYLTVQLLLSDPGRSSSSSPSSSSSSSSSPWRDHQPSPPPQLTAPNLRIELKEFPNVEKAFLTKRPLPPAKPSIQLFGDDTALDRRSLLVAVSIVNFYTNEILDEGNLQHNHPLPIVSGQCVSFPKLTITKTSKSFNDCLFCLQFDLRYYRDFSSFSAPRGEGEEDQQPPYQILHTIRSKAFRTISHAESITTDPTLSIPPPTLFEIIPESTDDTGEMKLAILGQNFVNQPSTLRINFGGSWGVPQYRSSKTLLCIPPRKGPGGVEVAVSNDGVQWSNSLSFTFHCHLPEGVVEGELGKSLELDLENVF